MHRCTRRVPMHRSGFAGLQFPPALKPVTPRCQSAGRYRLSRRRLVNLHSALSVVLCVHGGGRVSVTDSVTSGLQWTVFERRLSAYKAVA